MSPEESRLAIVADSQNSDIRPDFDVFLGVRRIKPPNLSTANEVLGFSPKLSPNGRLMRGVFILQYRPTVCGHDCESRVIEIAGFGSKKINGWQL
ncbi:hypothetical protein [uncultured Microbulbifer sp.]|uniref:hypothetical protein n=1 Tax=uncultured Microbulbifer sp. TaxID=348147 RepID=UPI002625F5BC|nr:hypothetical protein [uncultured Microbulbifer sp.]